MKKNRNIVIDTLKFLKGAHYPASQHELVNYVSYASAPHSIVDALQALPNKEYMTVGDVTIALGYAESAMVEDA